MNMRSTLILMAATVAPLCSAQDAPAMPTSQQLVALAANPAPTAATPEQRAAVFNALALLPPTVTDVLVLPNISENCAKLDENLRHEMDLPEGVDNAAIAVIPGTPATYALIGGALQSYQAISTATSLAITGMAIGSEPELFDTIFQQLVKGTAESLQKELGDAVSGPLSVPTAYAVLTCKPGHEADLQELHNRFQQEVRGGIDPEEGSYPVDDVNGWSGIGYDLAKPMGALLEELNKPAEEQEEASPFAEAEMKAKVKPVVEELAKQKLNIVSRVQGNALIIAVCGDPQQLRLAASPAESMLATDLLANCDANLGKGIIVASSTSPELANLYDCTTNYMYNIADGIASVFTALGEKDAANKDAFDQAAAGMSLLTKTLRSFTPADTKPTTLQAWHDGDLHIVLTTDAGGVSYKPGTLRLAAAADAPATVFYAESTPGVYDFALPTMQEMLDAALNVATGYALTLDEQRKPHMLANLGLAKAFMPEVNAALAAGTTIGSGFDGHSALIIDSAHAATPAFMGAPEGAEADVPRIGAYMGVADRSKLGEGWQALLDTAAQLAAKTGNDPAIIGQLPILPSQQGALTSYTVMLPLTSPDCVPDLTVSDTGLALGTSANMNARLIEGATGTLPFAGCVISFKPAPLAKSLRSLSLALDPTPEEAEPVAQSDVAVPSEPVTEEECEACVASEDGICEECYARMLAEAETPSTSRQERTAAQLAEAAESLEDFAEVVNGVNVSSTIEEGVHTLKVDVDFK